MPVAPPSPRRAGELVNIEARGIRVEVGRFVNEAKRLQMVRELQRELRGGSPV